MGFKKVCMMSCILIFLLVFQFTAVISYSATWEAPYPLGTYFELISCDYGYNPSINRVTMTYHYRNNLGYVIHSPRFVNLFLWSNDICSAPWVIMNYDGAGLFSNLSQNARVVEPDGYFNWHALITNPGPPLDSNGMFPSLPTQFTHAGVIYPYWNICTSLPGEWADGEVATISASWAVTNTHWVQSENVIVHCVGVDCPAVPDSDSDGVIDCDDNCPHHYNPTQQDTFPPQGDGIGDACDCEANFDCDQDVDANDVTAFLTGFGRSVYNRPCSNADQCKGDFSCDGDVDAQDVTKFLEDFGRNQYHNPCPACAGSEYCVY